MSSISETTDPATTQPVVIDRTGETARANLYLVLSRAFSSPMMMEQSIIAQIRQVATELPHALQKEAQSLATAWELGFAHREELSLAYARLFLGPFEILASPYASFYLQDDQQLMGPVSQSVANFYANAGLEPGTGPREAPDHVALEWEYMYFVTHQYLATGENKWIEQRQAFVSTHLSQWMPSLVDAIKHAGVHTFYDTLAVFLANLFKEPALLVT